jgi:hypothetical protein
MRRKRMEESKVEIGKLYIANCPDSPDIHHHFVRLKNEVAVMINGKNYYGAVAYDGLGKEIGSCFYASELMTLPEYLDTLPSYATYVAPPQIADEIRSMLSGTECALKIVADPLLSKTDTKKGFTDGDLCYASSGELKYFVRITGKSVMEGRYTSNKIDVFGEWVKCGYDFSDNELTPLAEFLQKTPHAELPLKIQEALREATQTQKTTKPMFKEGDVCVTQTNHSPGTHQLVGKIVAVCGGSTEPEARYTYVVDVLGADGKVVDGTHAFREEELAPIALYLEQHPEFKLSSGLLSVLIDAEVLPHLPDGDVPAEVAPVDLACEVSAELALLASPAKPYNTLSAEPEEIPVKPTNPKDALGIKKAPLHCVPLPPLVELGLAFMEGGRKYGSHNYRAMGVKASVYFDAIMRHLFAWWEGQDVDEDSGVSHVTKAIACLFVLRDAQLNNKCDDDRPIGSGIDFAAANKAAEGILEKYPLCKEPFRRKQNAED